MKVVNFLLKNPGYILGYVLLSFILWAFFQDTQSIYSAPLIVVIGTHIAIFGFVIGLTYHAIITYKLRDK